MSFKLFIINYLINEKSSALQRKLRMDNWLLKFLEKSIVLIKKHKLGLDPHEFQPSTQLYLRPPNDFFILDLASRVSYSDSLRLQPCTLFHKHYSIKNQ